MDWGEVLTVFAVVITNLATVISVYFHLDNKTSKTIDAIREDGKAFQHAVLSEMRDFHGRLCAIEERNKK